MNPRLCISSNPFGVLCLTLFFYCLLSALNSPAQADEDEDIREAPVERIASIGGRMINPVQKGSYLYACQGDSLRVFSLSNPKTPKPVAWIPLENIAHAAATSGSILYISTNSYNGGWSRPNECFDVSDPARPRRVPTAEIPESVFELSKQAPAPEGFPSMQGDLENVYGLLLAKSRILVFDGFGSWFMLEVADPSSPRSLGQIGLPPGETPVAMVDSFVPTISKQPCLAIFDASSPATCTLTATLGLPAPISSFAIEKHIGYIADGPGGLIIANLKNPAKPRILSRIATAQPCTGVEVSGSHAVIVAGDLFILDITDPARPHITSKIFVTGVMTDDRSGLIWNVKGTLEDWALSSSALVLLRGRYFRGSWLQIRPILKPTMTASAITANHYDCPDSVKIEGNLLVSRWYAYDSRTEMTYLRFHRLLQNLGYQPLGSYEQLLKVADFAIQDNIIYVADGQNGLVILRLKEGKTP